MVSHWGVTGGEFVRLTGAALGEVDFAVIQSFSFVGLNTPTARRVLAAVQRKQGVASALNDTVRELGGALGIALIGSVLNSGYRASIAAATESLPAEAADPADPRIAYIHHRGERLAMSAEQAQQRAVGPPHARQVGATEISEVGGVDVAISGATARLVAQVDRVGDVEVVDDRRHRLRQALRAAPATRGPADERAGS